MPTLSSPTAAPFITAPEPGPGSAPPLLRVEHLGVDFPPLPGQAGPRAAVEDVNLTIVPGETLALVGESGCGKSLTALALLGLLPEGARARGKAMFEGQNLLALSGAALRQVRGNRVSMIFQEPMTALNPVHTVGKQVAEVLRLHQGLSRKEAWERAQAELAHVRIPDPARVAAEYPHQLSGGMRQRVMIAMALACRPALLLADEPTTALDVTIQAQILDLMEALQRENGTAVLFITHDLGVVAQQAQRVAVMYAGRVVEEAPVDELFARPRHPYTRGLLGARPGRNQTSLAEIPGLVPPPGARPPGCAFAPRCPQADHACRQDPGPTHEPAQRAPAHFTACHHPAE
ncbi:MAG: ABC transporter ATP-binding protein [Deltaproteobacteria bacterium]|nr:ABC transporter ATP-binding protein [Deltaproteobacteria bacterium]